MVQAQRLRRPPYHAGERTDPTLGDRLLDGRHLDVVGNGAYGPHPCGDALDRKCRCVKVHEAGERNHVISRVHANGTRIQFRIPLELLEYVFTGTCVGAGS